MARAFAEIAFTADVLAEQAARGSRDGYAKFLEPDAEARNTIGDAEAQFIARRDGFYLSTVSQTGWPYVQFRGGPAGFLKVIDEKTLGFADFRGNRQYVSTGNLKGNDRASLILMDYPNQRRLKIWARARLIDGAEDKALMQRLEMPGYKARVERAVLLTVEAFDWNCPQHIPQRFTPEEFEAALGPIRDEMARLRAENAQLQAWISGEKPGS